MITENIIYFPHHQYNVKTERIKNLRVSDYINYGYIKLRDLDKWLDGKDIAVKMGMLSPTKDGYRELSVVESALKRIKEQDSTACFEDGDELVPVYIFVSNEMDNEWREYLMDRGYSITRRNASREGIRINRRDLSICYAERYNIDTKESLSYKEEQIKKIKEEEERKKKIEEEERRREKIIIENYAKQKMSYTKELERQRKIMIENYEEQKRSYTKDLERQRKIKSNFDGGYIDEENLDLYVYECTNLEYLIIFGWILFFSALIVTFGLFIESTFTPIKILIVGCAFIIGLFAINQEEFSVKYYKIKPYCKKQKITKEEYLKKTIKIEDY